MPPAGYIIQTNGRDAQLKHKHHWPGCWTVLFAIVPLAAKAYPGGSSGGDIVSHRLVFILAFVESVLDHVADRHQADEPLILDDREMARAFVRHFSHGHMDAFILARYDHLGGHVH